jgi:ribonuclease E
VALAVLRGLEDAIMAGARTPLVATTTPSVALYILNNKRPFINDMEARHGLPITVTGSDKLAGANFTIEKGAAPAQPQRRIERTAVNMDWGFDEAADGVEAEGEEVAAPREAREASRPSSAQGEEEPGDGSRRRRRRRRRGGRRGDRPEGEGAGNEWRGAPSRHVETSEDGAPMDAGDDDDDEAPVEAAGEPREQPRGNGEERGGQRSRRRGRRGGRRGRERRAAGGESPAGTGGQPDIGDFGADEGTGFEMSSEPRSPEPPRETKEPGPRAENERSRRREPAPEPAYADASYAGAPAEAVEASEPAPKRTRNRGGASEPRIERIVVSEGGEANAGAEAATEDSSAPTRKGWWQRRLSGD